MIAKDLSEILRWAYCLDYDRFLQVMGWPEDYYAKGRWDEMQSNFTRFFTNLDSTNQEKFVEGWKQKYKED